MKVVVTGAAGQLGGATVRRLASQADVVALTRAEVDLTDHDRVMSVVTAARPDLIVNCAAYNAVDQAEDDPPTALAVNAFAVQSLARAAAASKPSSCTTAPTSCSTVSRSSRMSRWIRRTRAASTANRNSSASGWPARRATAYVLRVESLFGGPAARSSVDKIIAALRSGQEAPVFVDRTVTRAMSRTSRPQRGRSSRRGRREASITSSTAGPRPGTISGARVARLLDCQPRLRPVKVTDVPLRAPRPQYCALSNAKLASAGFQMPTWQDALGRT